MQQLFLYCKISFGHPNEIKWFDKREGTIDENNIGAPKRLNDFFFNIAIVVAVSKMYSYISGKYKVERFFKNVSSSISHKITPGYQDFSLFPCFLYISPPSGK